MTKDLDILTMEFQDCWNVFKTQIGMADKTYLDARFGISLKFDIYDYLSGNILIRGRAGKVQIRGLGTFKLTDFRTELEMRERLMKEFLIEELGNEEVATPRGL